MTSTRVAAFFNTKPAFDSDSHKKPLESASMTNS